MPESRGVLPHLFDNKALPPNRWLVQKHRTYIDSRADWQTLDELRIYIANVPWMPSKIEYQNILAEVFVQESKTCSSRRNMGYLKRKCMLQDQNWSKPCWIEKQYLRQYTVCSIAMLNSIPSDGNHNTTSTPMWQSAKHSEIALHKAAQNNPIFAHCYPDIKQYKTAYCSNSLPSDSLAKKPKTAHQVSQRSHNDDAVA